MRYIKTDGLDLQIVERRNGGLAVHQGRQLLLLTRAEARELGAALIEESEGD